MSEPASTEEPIYTGPPIGHPRAKKIGTFSGLLSQQSPEFQAAIASLRAGLMSHQPGYAPMPYIVELQMLDGTKIESQSNASTDGVTPATGDCRVVLSRWNHNQLEWIIADIKGDEITLTVWRNPPDRQCDWRPAKPTIIPPPSTTASVTDNARGQMGTPMYESPDGFTAVVTHAVEIDRFPSQTPGLMLAVYCLDEEGKVRVEPRWLTPTDGEVQRGPMFVTQDLRSDLTPEDIDWFTKNGLDFFRWRKLVIDNAP